MADATFDTLQSDTVAQITSGPAAETPNQPTTTSNDQLIRCIEALTQQVCELRIQGQRGRQQDRARNELRSPSRTRGRSQTPSFR